MTHAENLIHFDYSNFHSDKLCKWKEWKFKIDKILSSFFLMCHQKLFSFIQWCLIKRLLRCFLLKYSSFLQRSWGQPSTSKYWLWQVKPSSKFYTNFQQLETGFFGIFHQRVFFLTSCLRNWLLIYGEN